MIAEIEHRLKVGTLKAGDQLPPERQFAEDLGVSRGAVREALRMLEAIGVLEAATGSGPAAGSTIVKDTTAGMGMVLRVHLQLASFTQDDLVETRLMLERLACRKAAGTATDEDIEHLRSLVGQMRGAHTTSDYHDIDAAFHIEIARISGNALAASLMAALREALRQAMVAAFESVQDPASTMERLTGEHDVIVDAIGAGDGDAAAELVAKHIVGFYRTVGFSKTELAG
ncbi:pyruvate dehydrogenase complex transcriptional repressor PdhR [soil metagenome]